MENTERILILDGMNQFLRNYIVDPSLDSNGEPAGGCKGFLKSLQKLSRETGKPSMIVIVWDGPGGSQKRRSLHENYKQGRKPIALNRNVVNLSDEQEELNRKMQFIKLIDYLNEMPVIQFMEEDVEADDVIAYLCRMQALRGKTKIIVSSDKDFFQLCDDETIILRPVQKEILNSKRIVENFKIHPNNFALARALAGDKSDNLDGIKGAGLKIIAKRFSFLMSETNWGLDSLFEFCELNKEKFKLYSDILDNKEKIELNYKIMQLYTPNISAQRVRHIKSIVENFKPEFNKTNILRKMVMDGFSDYNWDTLFQNFRIIVSEYSQIGN